jgi:hypothetical protein
MKKLLFFLVWKMMTVLWFDNEVSMFLRIETSWNLHLHVLFDADRSCPCFFYFSDCCYFFQENDCSLTYRVNGGNTCYFKWSVLLVLFTRNFSLLFFHLFWSRFWFCFFHQGFNAFLNASKGYCGGNLKSCAAELGFYLFCILLMFFLQMETLRQVRLARYIDLSSTCLPFVFLHLSKVPHTHALFRGAPHPHGLRIWT